jgi:hypothetical protein
MPTSKSKSLKRRTKVDELPAKQKKLTGADMKKVKGGVSPNDIAYEVQKEKMKTANKNADATRNLL